MKLVVLFITLCMFYVCLGEEFRFHAHLAPLLRHTDASQGNPSVFRFVLSNPSENPVTVLKWGTPLEGRLAQPIFNVVSTTGEPAPYEGVIVDRILPSSLGEAKSEFETLLPGQSTAAEIDISQDYRFDANATYEVSVDTYITFFPGTFEEISEKYLLFSLSEDEERVSPFSISPLVTNSIKMFISNPIDHINRGKNNLKVNFQNCSPQRQTAFWQYREMAIPMCTQALNYLTQKKCDGAYVSYFGGYQNTNRYQTVTQHFTNICNNARNNNFNVICDTGNCNGWNWAIAFVFFADRNHNIHVCEMMWSQQVSWRAQNLLHELSHFDDVAATRDHVYGDAQAKNLARTDPNRAIFCAENHGLFSLNNPRC